MNSRPRRAWAQGVRARLHVAHIVPLSVVLIVLAWRAGASNKLQRLREQLAECRSEVGYLCWELREVNDAAFRGDMAVMAHRIESLPQPAAPPQQRLRGIVVPAGGQQYAANAFLNLYVLRHHFNCSLPAAIVNWGKSERDAVRKELQAFMKAHLSDIEFVDASTLPYPAHHRWLFPPGDDSRFNGWKVKVFALYSAPFEEVLLLDGDSTPFQDVAPLFDHPAFQQHGSMLWRDAWCRPVKLFQQLDISDPWRGGRREWQADSGQLLFNRRMHPDVLEWLLFLNTHDEFTYHYAFGDKDTFRAAFYLANKSGAYYQGGGPGWLVRGFLQHDPDGNFLFLHRAGGSAEWPRKYDCRSEGGQPISHVLIQPSCDWVSSGPGGDVSGKSVDVSRLEVLTPGQCSYDLVNAHEALRACGLRRGEGLEAGAPDPPVFEVTAGMHLAKVQQRVDAAFQMLRQHLQEDPTLC